MRKRTPPLGLAAIAVILILSACEDEPPAWTSSSPAAVAEFERALEAVNKLYFSDAIEGCERSLELDPEFVAAKTLMLQIAERERRKPLYEELSAVDLSSLTPRERFIAEYVLAEYEERSDDAGRILEAYREEEPGDPFALYTVAERAWRAQDLDTAERYYRELIERHPNWVRAQNYLGYIEMARGNFDAAEDHFRTYMFVAPDQANPYDSLGELLILLGREAEAEEALRRGLEIRPDFCASYNRLIDLEMLRGDYGSTAEVVDAAAVHCDDGGRTAGMMQCRSDVWSLYDESRFEEAWEVLVGSCREVHTGDLDIVRHRIALLTTRFEEAAAIEELLRQTLQKVDGVNADYGRAALAHMEGVRLASAGEFDDATDALRRCDRYLRYWAVSEGTGMFKIYNLLNLARALERAERGDDAQAILADIASVNPTMAARYDRLHLGFEP